MSKFYIDKIGIDITNLQDALEKIIYFIDNKKFGYICVTNSRTVHLANHDDDYLKIQNKALLTVPDGVPLVWIARNLGYKSVDRVSGPDLFPAVLELSKSKKYSHYFYGSTPNTIAKIEEKMKRNYPSLEVKGAVSPPFQPIADFDIDALAVEINRLKPTFFWCGLGAPKQEQLMALLQPKLESTICVGVGLVFEYFAGTVSRAPVIIQKLGLEWLHRLLQQPVKMIRFIKPFMWISVNLFQSFFNKNNPIY
ncbi:WecB/TagA/CpsF family glycosyltransferase [Petrimonas mucosa]|uniref:Putative N-acetylmannosaminyltransferase n=1 Tax=Petrimonas mucosa TaxID=1642646 RepID=A0A1G4GAT2_9BACT|nr:WecB/TagA/CpsF family glycosyltransferase [Petrimonas mucosa]SCM59627.1 putative N-acetylmannosaminyltransferase [Petrimonas mucosa]